MKKNPNIIQIIWHDLGRHLGCYGYPGIATPHLDRFAGEGVLFEQMFCASPGCSPSRASILTGCYPHTNGMHELAHIGGHYAPDQKTLAHVLAGHGYPPNSIWHHNGNHTFRLRITDPDLHAASTL